MGDVTDPDILVSTGECTFAKAKAFDFAAAGNFAASRKFSVRMYLAADEFGGGSYLLGAVRW